MQTHVEAHLADGVKIIEQVETGEKSSWPFAESEVWILTACNPESRPLRDEENAQRHKQLGEQLAELNLNFFYCRGFDSTADAGKEWSEDGYGVVGEVGDVVCELARVWEQNAVFIWRPTEFVIHGILLQGETKSGWRYV